MDPVAGQDTHFPVYQAARSLLETYKDILHDIYGNPEDRPMVLTEANKERFLSSLSDFNKQVEARGVPIAHSDKRPYGGEAARGAVDAMCLKLRSAGLFLKLGGEDPRMFDDLLSGLSPDAWISFVQDQAAGPALVASPPPALPAFLTGNEAAKAIGINPATLSRWQSNVPAWVGPDDQLHFRDLIDREGGRYRRDKVLRLAAWFQMAQKLGGQRATPTP